jgi:hypothetical protein
VRFIFWVFLSSTALLTLLVIALSISTRNISKRPPESVIHTDEQVIDYPSSEYYTRLKYLHDENGTLFVESDTVLSFY